MSILSCSVHRRLKVQCLQCLEMRVLLFGDIGGTGITLASYISPASPTDMSIGCCIQKHQRGSLILRLFFEERLKSISGLGQILVYECWEDCSELLC